ncbi:rhodanese-like domain-containing protein [Aerococcus viridans]|uniref:rhodanese-like domain-containing protein n=1 Tax=Aerococcus viridans TaxID=1377 RepID=UPI003AA8A340
MFFKKMPTISTTELEKKLADKPQIIDVREPHEFKNGHIPGAKNMPLSKVANYTPKGQVYVVCQSGMRSKRATKTLLEQGHEAINVRGGMMAWTGATKGGKN